MPEARKLGSLSPRTVWIPVAAGLMAAMFLLSWIQKRFGWRWALIFLAVASLYQINRERFWFSTITPFLEYQPGWGPILAEASIFGTGGLLALAVMRWVHPNS